MKLPTAPEPRRRAGATAAPPSPPAPVAPARPAIIRAPAPAAPPDGAAGPPPSPPPDGLAPSPRLAPREDASPAAYASPPDDAAPALRRAPPHGAAAPARAEEDPDPLRQPPGAEAWAHHHAATGRAGLPPPRPMPAPLPAEAAGADGPGPDPLPGPARRGWLARLRRAPAPAEAAAARLRAIGTAARPHPEEPPASADPRPAEAGEPSGDAARRGPAPPRALAEGLGGLLALAVLDLALGSAGFGLWPVHPFWLPVLWTAARHGLAAGLVVAVAAAAARLGLGLSSGLLTAATWAEPLAWPLAAALVGALADRGRAAAAAARAEVAAAAAARAALEDSNTRLAQRAVELEGRLVARIANAGALFDAARALGQGTEGVIRGALPLVRAATGASAASFWLAEGRALHLVAAEGWPADASLARSFARGALPDAIAGARGALLALRPADRLALEGEGVLACAVRSPWDGTLLGMVKVEDLGFEELAADTVAALEAACGWLGAALAEARGQEAQAAALEMPGGGVTAGDEASRAISTMAGLARRLGFPLALLSAEIRGGPRAAVALEAARAAMADGFRGSDLLLEARRDDRRLSVLLPGADLRGAEVAAERLRTLLSARAPGALEGVTVAVTRLDGRHG